MRARERRQRSWRRALKWAVIVAFVLFYPMLLSIYVFLPLFIGAVGYVLLLGMERNRPSYVIAAMAYLVNLDINLFVPFWLTLLAVFPVYWFVFPMLKAFRRCPQCAAFISVLVIDLLFLGVVKAYDFVMQTTTVALDSILFYTLLVDLIVAVML